MSQTSFMISRERANDILRENFAPWVQDLGLIVEQTGTNFVDIRLPWRPNHAHEDGGFSTQALLAAVDAATVLAVSSLHRGYVPMTAVQQSTSFHSKVVRTDVIIHAQVEPYGGVVHGEVVVSAAGSSDPAVKAATIYSVGG